MKLEIRCKTLNTHEISSQMQVREGIYIYIVNDQGRWHKQTVKTVKKSCRQEKRPQLTESVACQLI